MPIEFKCPNCGTPLTAPDTAAGSSGPCPRCKARVTAPASVFTQAAEPALDTSDMSLEIDLGSVTSVCGELHFRLKIDGYGRGHLQIYAFDPDDMRESGILLLLDEGGYGDLKRVLAKADATIQKIRSAGQMRGMILPY